MTESTETEHGLDLPNEVLESMEAFKDGLASVDNVLVPMLAVPLQDLTEKLEPLQAAKFNLVTAYAVNSLFWMYLITKGLNPREHAIKQELDRIKKYMGKLKDISDKKNAMTLDKAAAKRFVKSALWEQQKGNENEPSRAQKRKETTHYKKDKKKKKKVKAD